MVSRREQLWEWTLEKACCQNMGCYRQFTGRTGKRFCSRRCARQDARRRRELDHRGVCRGH